MIDLRGINGYRGDVTGIEIHEGEGKVKITIMRPTEKNPERSHTMLIMGSGGYQDLFRAAVEGIIKIDAQWREEDGR